MANIRRMIVLRWPLVQQISKKGDVFCLMHWSITPKRFNNVQNAHELLILATCLYYSIRKYLFLASRSHWRCSPRLHSASFRSFTTVSIYFCFSVISFRRLSMVASRALEQHFSLYRHNHYHFNEHFYTRTLKSIVFQRSRNELFFR